MVVLNSVDSLKNCKFLSRYLTLNITDTIYI